jgi:hypothetical protein
LRPAWATEQDPSTPNKAKQQTNKQTKTTCVADFTGRSDPVTQKHRSDAISSEVTVTSLTSSHCPQEVVLGSYWKERLRARYSHRFRSVS